MRPFTENGKIFFGEIYKKKLHFSQLNFLSEKFFTFKQPVVNNKKELKKIYLQKGIRSYKRICVRLHVCRGGKKIKDGHEAHRGAGPNPCLVPEKGLFPLTPSETDSGANKENIFEHV